MKAKMKYNLIPRYKNIMPECFDTEVEELLRRIEGKEVNLVFIDGDAFEEKDNNIWLPDSLWDKA